MICGYMMKSDEDRIVKSADERHTTSKKVRITEDHVEKDVCKRGTNPMGLNKLEVISRATWRKKITNYTSNPHEREKPGKMSCNQTKMSEMETCHIRGSLYTIWILLL